jgi:hypothetical protein
MQADLAYNLHERWQRNSPALCEWVSGAPALPPSRLGVILSLQRRQKQFGSDAGKDLL